MNYEIQYTDTLDLLTFLWEPTVSLYWVLIVLILCLFIHVVLYATDGASEWVWHAAAAPHLRRYQTAEGVCARTLRSSKVSNNKLLKQL